MGWIENIHGEVLLVKQKRGRKLWSLPGGKIGPAESLEQGLIREVREETSLRVKYCHFFGILDRPEKANLTILYRVVIHAGNPPVAQRSEIAEIKFRGTLPRDATPSLRYFWRMMRVGGGPSQ
ncbi:MAG: NUDIX hydrolase [Ilumatobacteraceae bacterium]